MKARLTEEAIAMRVVKELKDGDCVNLGFGIPTLVSSFVPEDKKIFFHSENGLIGYGKVLTMDEADKWDYDLINGGGQFVAPLPGMCVVDHCNAFIVVRGGRLDAAVLGALQVSEKGDLANWARQADWKQYGAFLGGAVDMPVGAKRVIIAMKHTTEDGRPKIVKKCSYPLTCKNCVDLIISDLGAIEVANDGLILKEIIPGWTVEEVQALTEPELIVADDLKEMEL